MATRERTRMQRAAYEVADFVVWFAGVFVLLRILLLLLGE